MHSLSRLFAAAVVATAFATPAHAVTYQFTTALDGAQAGTASPAMGSGMLSYDDASNLLSWDIAFSGLQGTETAAHFHGPATPGNSAGIQIGLPLSSPKIGTATLNATQESDLLNDLWYVNIHSTVAPSGEIRGQLLMVPEPQVYATLLAGLALVGWATRRRPR